MRTKKLLVPLGTLSLVILLFFFGCKNENYEFSQGHKGAPYDPNSPVVISGFLPDSGKIREKVVITGTNFGNDPAKVKVYFSDGFLDKEAIVVSVDGSSIYCLAPRLTDGKNQIKVSVSGSEPVAASKPFHYTAAANVSWIAGVGTRDGTGAQYVNGTLAESKFWKIHGLVALNDNQIMTFGFWEGKANNVRLISVDEDKVITIQEGIYLGKPAVNDAKTRVYASTLNPPYSVYEYRKESGWTPYMIGEMVIPNHGTCCDFIRCLVMMDKEHDPEQEWLYFCHKEQTFGRFNVFTGETEILADGTLKNLPVNEFGGYLAYDKFKDCFYLSLYKAYSIYKITKKGKDWTDGVEAELYAGSPSESSVTDGDLENARFRTPMGICVDDDGNLYVCDADNANVIRKIGTDGYVTTIAGVVGVAGAVNGDPSEATFLVPQDISYDGDGNFYIAEFWESTIRKYSIE